MCRLQLEFLAIVGFNINQIKNFTETNATQCERIKLNALQMHDVRNYVQSLDQFVTYLNQSINDNDDVNYIDKFNQNIFLNQSDRNSNKKQYKQSDKDDLNEQNLQKIKSDFDQNIQQNIKKISKYQQNAEKNLKNNIEILKNNQKQTKTFSNDLNKSKFNKFKRLSKPSQEIDLDISFENMSIFNDQDDQFTYVENNQETNLIVNENSTKNKLSTYSKSNVIQDLLYKIDNPNEMINIIKFIKQKINFLQHLELTFELNQNIKSIETNPTDILNYISKNMKILFLNKQNDIALKLESKINNIIVDIFMLKYLICQIASYLHRFNSNIIIIMKFEKHDINKYLLQISANGFNINQNCNQSFTDLQIFEKIIQNLGLDIKYDYNYDKNFNEHSIKISQTTTGEQIEEIPDNYQFCEINKIKEDAITPNQHQNVFIFEKKTLSVINNYIFINIDDESNILRMHTHLFDKLGLPLVGCSTSDELKALMIQIQTQQGTKPQVVVLLDHILDGKFGIDLYRELRVTQVKFELDIKWVVVSSTEDLDTIKKYREESVEQFVDKPLSIMKINDILDKVGYLGNNDEL